MLSNFILFDFSSFFQILLLIDLILAKSSLGENGFAI